MEKKVKKAIAVKVLVIVLVLAIVVALISVVVVNTTEKTNKETAVQAMGEREDYIKAIEKVEKSNEHMDIIEDKNGEKVPVPKGYVGSDIDGENTVQDGYVIYEKTSEEISSNQDVKITEDNKLQARKERNQYVWVPVSKEKLSTMYGIDENGKYLGKQYAFSESYDNETGTSPNNWSESEGVMRINSATSYREPDIVSRCDNPQYFRQYGVVAESTEEYLMNLEREYEVTLESIAKYGGFYIGRYETGGLSGEAVVRKMNEDIASQPWYVMYEKCKELRGANKNVTTSMIFGSQFDRVLMWLIESGDKTKAQVITDSKEWGNYYNVTLQYDSNGDGNEDSTKKENISSKRIPAGSSEQTIANNIYDLAGNVHDWTIAACYTYYRVLRGGSYDSYSDGNSAIDLSGTYPDSSSISYGCRAALFIR